MGEVNSHDLESACFKVNKNVSSAENTNENLILDLNTESLNNKLKNNKGKCLGLKKSYWSSIFNDNEKQDSPELILGDCGSFDNKPTTFSLHKEDKTIRLKDASRPFV